MRLGGVLRLRNALTRAFRAPLFEEKRQKRAFNERSRAFNERSRAFKEGSRAFKHCEGARKARWEGAMRKTKNVH